jgi:adenylate cyclase class 2
MHYEVEQKFRVADRPMLEAKLNRLGIQWGETVGQVDSYFAHPSRDFAQTDEALRIRRVGSANFVTYKGPKIDATTKTRRELELPLLEGEAMAGQFRELLVALGFHPVTDVVKQRRYGHVQWEGQDAEIVVDDVAEVGLFVEIELTADAEHLDTARKCLASLAAAIELASPERRSYLELLLEGRVGR